MNSTALALQKRAPKKARRGAIAPLTAVLLIPLLVVMAFCLDLGYIVAVKTELQNTADAAALAGASQMLIADSLGVPNTTALANTSIANSRSEAQTYSYYNKGGNVNLRLLDSDVTVGYLSDPFSSQAVTSWTSGTSFPNTVQVTVRRDGSANTPLPLFVSSILGTSSWNGTATARASVLAATTVTGFKGVSGGPRSKLLPIAILVDSWKDLLSTGKSPDGHVHDDYKVYVPSSDLPSPNNVTGTSDNIPELTEAFPKKTAPGNFGLLSIGPPATDTPTFSEWILNGPSPEDLAYFGPDGLQGTVSNPISTDSPYTVAGGPGLKSTLIDDFNAVIGQQRIIPLYSSYADNGSNATYSIVGFAGVTIVEARLHGSNIELTVQPMVVIDGTATTTSGGSGDQFIYSTSPLALTK